jgi:hypothetical protein
VVKADPRLALLPKSPTQEGLAVCPNPNRREKTQPVGCYTSAPVAACQRLSISCRRAALAAANPTESAPPLTTSPVASPFLFGVRCTASVLMRCSIRGRVPISVLICT